MGLICTPYGYSGAAKVPGLNYQGIILGDKPVAYWPLNETSGAVAHDLSGNGINGTLNGGVTLGESGIPGAPGAFLFDGSTGNISIPNSSLLALTASGSVESWVYPSNTTSPIDILAIGTASGQYNNAYRCRLNNLNADLVYAVADQLSSPSGVSTTGFSQIVFTFDANSAAQIYVNGVLVATGGADYTTSAGSPVNGAIGVNPGNSDPTEYFSGKLSNIAIYNTILSATQIQNHYNAGIA